jgi:epoxide hydrolase-like predicted phosphatase
MQRAIIFDFGGVLMKTEDYRPRHGWDDRLGLPHGSVEQAVHNATSWVQAQCGQISNQAYWQDVAAQLHLSSVDTRQLALDFYSGDRLDLDLIEYIRQLRDNGHPVGLLSNAAADLAAQLQDLGIADLFDPTVISAHIGVMKPAPEAYRAVLDRLRRPPEEVIFIDDRPENVNGARAVGIHGVHYTDGMNLPAALSDILYA